MSRDVGGILQGLERAGARALLIVGESAGDPDLAPFVGDAHLGESFVLFAKGGSPRLGFLTPMERDEAAATGVDLLTPEQLDVERWARDASDRSASLAGVLGQAMLLSGVAPGTILVAGRLSGGRWISVARRLAADGFVLADGEELLLRWRKRKSAKELAAARAASLGTGEALRRIAAILGASVVRGGELWNGGERVTVRRLRGEIAGALARRALEQPRGNIVAPGEEGGVPHTAGTAERTLRPHESLVVDLYPRGSIFADCTRTFCVGEPPEILRRAHVDVLDALTLARRSAMAGSRAWLLQEAVCAHFTARGWTTPISQPGTARGYVHGLGHGVGFELHEYPSFRRTAGEEGLLERDDLFTLEPGLYEPGPDGFGVRLEDLVALSDEGVETLTPFPYDLDPRAWLAAASPSAEIR